MTPQEAQAMIDSRPQAQAALTPEIADKLAREEMARRVGSNPNAYEPIKHIAAGLTKFGQNMANIPNNITRGAIPEFSRKSFDPYETFGIKEGLADKIGTEVLGFLPFGKLGSMAAETGALRSLPGSEMLKANILGGASYGAVNNPQDRLMGAAEGGGIGALAHGLGLAAGATGNAIYNSYAKSAIPALVEKAGQYIKSGLGSPGAGATALKGQYDKISGHADKLWETARNRAAALESSGSKIDSSPVEKYIKGFMNDVKKLNPASRREYMDAVEFIKKEGKGLIPKNYADVMALRRGSNETVSDFLKTKNKEAADVNLNKFVTGLKEKLGDTLPSNTQAEKNFKTGWDIANKATARKKEFYQAPGTGGTLEPSKKLRTGLKSANPEGSLVDEFLPTSAQTGTHGFRQLANLLGSNKQAQQALRNYEFRNLGNKKDALDVYQPLSRAQRQVMFDKEPRNLLGAAQEASQRYFPGGHEKDSRGIQLAKIAGYHLLPGAIAGGGAYSTGHDARAALGIGAGVALGGAGLSKGLGAYAARNPESVRQAMAAAQMPTKNPGLYLNPLFNAYFGSKQK